MKIRILYPNYFRNSLIAYVVLSIAESMHAINQSIRVMGISSSDVRLSIYSDAIPQVVERLAFKFVDARLLKKITEYRFKSMLRPGDIVCLWPGTSTELYRDLNSKGYVVVKEMVNCHQLTSQRILSDEYVRLSLPKFDGISDDEIKEETDQLALSDIVISPSPMVRKSLLSAGVPESKIINSSFGWAPSKVYSTKKLKEKPSAGVTVAFVGTLCVRKGVHLLKEIWGNLHAEAKLLIVGRIAPDFKHRISGFLEQKDVEHYEWLDDLSEIYSRADVFVLPSLEEGSPLVIYDAMGAGLPIIASPMGGGGL